MSEEPSTGKIISNEVLQLTSQYLKPRPIMQRFYFEDDISDALHIPVSNFQLPYVQVEVRVEGNRSSDFGRILKPHTGSNHITMCSPM